MNQRSIAARLVTQLLKLRYTHLIRQAWQAVRMDYINHTGSNHTSASAGNDALNNTAEALIALSHDDEHFGDLVCTMVDTLPHDDPLSLAFFFHILELIALPSSENAIQLSERLLHKTSSDHQVVGMTSPVRPVHDQPQVILDADAAIGRWKISPDWLEVRNDHTAFSTIWSNCPITLGTWYYEVTLITSGIMQIGWSRLTGDNVFECDEGIGVGDTVYSLGYDGCRRLTWAA
ncbi:hypothetical protein SYNPS1DRAFT_23684 [Syncephalis pseudoplumigaleata]|uniref:SPRY domain-containing protein n=1 Tax=Syncephalis pseudoplumigaleata TaxID=1712513 RepID=A0A4P9YXG9_9FUNG|nr:hypothetical protein SYNPS1DRAFT_23684 [Syncephalis pseudoplumigaleata]|eukprot:RKP24222.1 hypothetical protein SYNPS1DRAFT_23684 [Syncephalis pseudoplumigaleata]